MFGRVTSQKKINLAGISFYRGAILIVLSLVNIQCSPLLKKPQSSVTAAQPRKQNIECPLFFEKALVCASLLPDREPHAGEKLSFYLKFWSLRPNQASTTEGDKSFNFEGSPQWIPFVFLWMPMATGSHGSLPTRTVPARYLHEEWTPGDYQVQRVIFTMPGAWEIHVQLKNQDGSIYDEVVELIEIQ